MKILPFKLSPACGRASMLKKSFKPQRHKGQKENLTKLCVLCAFVVKLGCGPYSFSGAASTHIKTIAVPVFEDRTAEFGVKDRLSNAIIEEFTRDNTLKIADRRVADSVLLGTLLSVQETASVYNQQESVQEVRVTVTVQLKYEDVKKRKTVWEKKMAQFGTYSPRSASSSRQAAIDEAIRKIANEVRNETVSDW
jgi:hypothetical protein